MPGGRGKPDQARAREQRRLKYGVTGKVDPVGQDSWDFKTELFAEAVMQLMTDGVAVMFSSTANGRVIGATLWEGDFKHPRQWLYSSEEVDEWAANVVRAGKAEEAAN